MEFEEFILAHEGDDLGALALARDRYAGEIEDFDLALTTLEVRRKLRTKVPEWYAVPGLRYPLRVSGEQCSSSETARYKALVAAMAGVAPNYAKNAQNALYVTSDCKQSHEKSQKRVRPCTFRLADLTGGLGVDSWAFAQVATEVLYNEMRPELADAARSNFAALGVKNITVRSAMLVPAVMTGSDRSSVIPSEASVSQILGDFRPDVIFLDPARRASDGRKVFRLEGCQPDVLQLLPELLSACPLLLLKLSPMADISLVCKQLTSVKEVHVVAADGECKELLLLLERDYVGPYSLTIYENGDVMEIPGQARDEERRVRYKGLIPASEPGSLDRILFEPGKALLKAGAFGVPCQYGLSKLGQHTHLYVGEEVPEALKPFGKCFHVLEAAPLNNRSIKDIGTRYPSASVTARNIPLTSDQLRKKLGVSDGGSVHIFGVHVDAFNANYLLVCTTA